MSHSLSQVYLHVVFSTKGRKPFFSDSTLRKELHAYLSEICKIQSAHALDIGGTADHVHILCQLPKTLCIAELVRELKHDSLHWMRKSAPEVGYFQWQVGYGAFSVSPGHLEALIEYIADQESHHQEETYQEEFRRICEKYYLEVDEQCVWD